MKSVNKTETIEENGMDCLLDQFHKFNINDSSKDCSSFNQKFEITKELYTSPNSSVYKVNIPFKVSFSEKEGAHYSGKQGAVKLVKGATFCQLLEKEYKLLRDIEHPNIVKPLDFKPSEKSGDESTSYLCVPYYKHGEMFEVAKAKGGLGETDSLLYFQQVASALEYLHDMEIAHRDIKLENILLDDELNAQLIDFGFSAKFDTDSTKDIHTRIVEHNLEAQIMGTVAYMAPELLESNDKTESAKDRFKRYKAGDVFALGVTLFTMVVGMPPFTSANKRDTNYRNFFLSMKREDATRFWTRHPKAKVLCEKGLLSAEFRSLIEGMLHPDSSKRISMSSVVNHPWVKQTANFTIEDLKKGVQEVVTSA